MLRHAARASSSRKNDSDRILPLSVRLSNRSIEMKPSMVSRIGPSSAARSRYSCLRSGFGRTSKITAIIFNLPWGACDGLQCQLSQEGSFLRQDQFVFLGEIKIGHSIGV